MEMSLKFCLGATEPESALERYSQVPRVRFTVFIQIVGIVLRISPNSAAKSGLCRVTG